MTRKTNNATPFRFLISAVFALAAGALVTGTLVVSAPAVAAVSFEPVGEKAAITAFTKPIEDLPVMPGLEVVEEKDVFILFGDQRFAQTTLRGGVDIDEVYYFYENVLPQLGWKRQTAKIYARDGEILSMRPSSANRDGMTYVRFEVEPETAFGN